MNNVIPFDKPKSEPKMICSFCQKPQEKDTKLMTNDVTGREFRCICSKCMVKCKQLLVE